jgi:hypothetical protein
MQFIETFEIECDKKNFYIFMTLNIYKEFF